MIIRDERWDFPAPGPPDSLRTGILPASQSSISGSEKSHSPVPLRHWIMARSVSTLVSGSKAFLMAIRSSSGPRPPSFREIAVSAFVSTKIRLCGSEPQNTLQSQFYIIYLVIESAECSSFPRQNGSNIHCYTKVQRSDHCRFLSYKNA